MRISIYARVSSRGGRQDVQNQLLQLREWAKCLGGEVITEYVDEASGSKSDRIALQKLLNDAHKRKFDLLLVWALDRLSREGVARMAGYIEQLKTNGIRVMSHQEPWLDTAGPVGELLTAVFSWVAKFERQRTTERIYAGLERARKQGRKLGRPQTKFDMDKALKLRSEGNSIRLISQIVGVPRSTLAGFLSEKGSSIKI